jgi:hypothetical protein
VITLSLIDEKDRVRLDSGVSDNRDNRKQLWLDEINVPTNQLIGFHAFTGND